MNKMKKIYIVLAVIFIVAGGWLLNEVLNWKVNETMTVTAHAGALDTEANSGESIRASLEFLDTQGFIEVDVQLREDGTPVLRHDADDLSQAITLEDCLALLRDYGACINLDFKNKQAIAPAAELVKSAGLDLERQVIATGIAFRDEKLIRESGLRYLLNCQPKPFGWDAQSLINKAIDMGAAGLNIPYKFCSEKLVKLAHEQGLVVSVWTVDKEADMKRMLRLGVDNITTRHPDRLLEIINHAL